MTAVGGVPYSSRKGEVVDTRKAWMREPIRPGLTEAELEKLAGERFGLKKDQKDRWNLTLALGAGEARAKLRELVQWLRDDERLRMNMLLDVVGVDYLSYPNHRGPRFAVIYLLKSLHFRHRFRLKVEVEEDDCELPSISHLYRIADWAEREVFDQFGVRFLGHPNLRRLLNHHEFVGHPLRKDYPAQKRQKLSMNDPTVDQLELRLRDLGFTVVEAGELHLGKPIAARHQSAAEQGQVDPQRSAGGQGAIGAGGL
jgi:NADH-quinone oxidoreductase subunit C